MRILDQIRVTAKVLTDVKVVEITDILVGPQPIKAQLFFKDYYTDTADMGTQFTRERKVKIWLNNCNFQSRTSISDISNAWTNMI